MFAIVRFLRSRFFCAFDGVLGMSAAALTVCVALSTNFACGKSCGALATRGGAAGWVGVEFGRHPTIDAREPHGSERVRGLDLVPALLRGHSARLIDESRRNDVNSARHFGSPQIR